MPFGVGAAGSRPGRPPQQRSGASDQTPTSANSSTMASSRVSIARNASSTAVIGLPTLGRRRCSARPRAPAWVRDQAVRARTSASATVTAADRPAASQRVAALGVSRARRGFGAAQPGRGTDQQDAGQATADGRFGQRDIDTVQLHPGQRQQQPVGDEADDRGKRFARDDRPHRQAEDQQREADVAVRRSCGAESLCAHVCARSVATAVRRTAARAARCTPA